MDMINDGSMAMAKFENVIQFQHRGFMSFSLLFDTFVRGLMIKH